MIDNDMIITVCVTKLVDDAIISPTPENMEKVYG